MSSLTTKKEAKNLKRREKGGTQYRPNQGGKKNNICLTKIEESCRSKRRDGTL